MASYGLYTSPPITYHLCKPYPWSYGLIRVRRRSKNDWKWARISLYLIKKRVFMREMLHLQALEYLWECQNCICDVLLSSKLVLDLNLDQFWGSKRNSSPAGNWTPVSRSTGGILTTTLSRMRWRFAEFCKTLESITLHKDMGFSLCAGSNPIGNL